MAACFHDVLITLLGLAIFLSQNMVSGFVNQNAPINDGYLLGIPGIGVGVLGLSVTVGLPPLKPAAMPMTTSTTSLQSSSTSTASLPMLSLTTISD
ncbi:hypothetical protein HDU76_008261, partial [Blyttiomyces sp. JEL0837]